MIRSLLLKIKLLIKMEECKMVDGYTILIMHGVSTIERVPARHKDAVLVKLAALGLDGEGKEVKSQE